MVTLVGLTRSKPALRRMPDMLLCIRDNFEMTPALEDTTHDSAAVAESFMNVLFQHGRLRCFACSPAICL